VLLEAMYFGKPLVSTNILGSGSTWINQHEQTGYIVPINNSEAIATAVKDILKDPVKYARFSKNAKERFNQYFTKNFMIDTFEKLYRKVVK
jgi:glycosyltransferase involved in cell wall biosynthesis